MDFEITQHKAFDLVPGVSETAFDKLLYVMKHGEFDGSVHEIGQWRCDTRQSDKYVAISKEFAAPEFVGQASKFRS